MAKEIKHYVTEGSELRVMTKEESKIREKFLADAAKTEYLELRKTSYPSVGDQLAAIWDCLTSVPMVTEEAAIILEKINKVKEKYPKPEEAE